MEIKKYKDFFIQQLSAIYPLTEIENFFFFLVEEYLNLERIDTVLNPNFKIDENKISQLNTALERLQNEEPIQYILGKTEFYGFPFLVTKDTLIPRPETEELVEWMLQTVRKNNKENLNILDIGTGSGCIPVSLQKELEAAHISAIDISEDALKIAKKNADLNKVNIHFYCTDILKTSSLTEIINSNTKFEIIVSNPPYVRALEKEKIKNNVLQNEPHLALFVDDHNPLIFYDKIADLAKENLSKGGFLFFEINQYLGAETVNLLSNKGFKNIQLRKDLFGNNRMIRASLD